jgi:transitional endoplasmic reticulum ATPase
MSQRYRPWRAAIPGGTQQAFRLASNVAQAADRRMPEASALARWADQDRAPLGLPDKEDFAASTPRQPLTVANWRRLRTAPAIAATALRATRLAGGDAGTVQLILQGIARSVDGGHTPAAVTDPLHDYDPALVQADCDLPALADRLARAGAPRAISVLLSGPPGTGKSAFARHLAARMGLELLHRRASYLLGPFVGQTEANIAAAFAEAAETGAFLIFDEADSLLGDRATARHGWEISQVNEMLTWMEQHPMPFACTTNLPDRLDPASLRRFLIKLRLGWLTAAQARLAFRRFFAVDPPSGLDALRTLTPADFALVRRQAAATGASDDPAGLLYLLAAECEGRAAAAVPVGFRVA